MGRKPKSKLDEVLDRQQHLFDDAPADLTPPQVNLPIGSLESLDWLLRELGWIVNRKAEVKARASAETQAVKERAAAMLWVDVAGERVGLDDRERQLREAAEEFCRKHRRSLLVGELKSRQLSHGEFGWEQSRPKVVPLERPGKGPGEWFDALLKLLKAAWAKLPGLPGKSAAFLTIKPTVNRTKLKEAALAGTVDGDDLKLLGFRLLPAGDAFFVRPAGVTLSASEEPSE